MVVKIFFENTPDLRWVAILLDKNAPDLATEDPVAMAGSVSPPPTATQAGTSPPPSSAEVV